MSLFKAENLPRADHRTALPEPRHTVLVVDDVRANAAVMAAILRPHFHLLEAHDGAEALALIDTMPPSQQLACIVSDHRMPGMSGLQLLLQVRDRLPQTRRVMVTGYMDMDALVDAINRAEIYRFVAKPFDTADFLLTVRCAVAAFEAARTHAAVHSALEQRLERSPETTELLGAAHNARREQEALEAQLLARQSGRT
jgi:response regulator RpfG family c-di-GMP phosphodiesterase